ncbi:ABC transporter substrate-binding protein [Sagittula sp. NFXS13]|uniref:extracellular solute-binding protein n=1 Tax=Sagittula sp. NFXS13 TaxID=2819095 RepID=UPI0032DE3748
MNANIFSKTRRWSVSIAAILVAGIANAEPQHGIAMYGEPELPPDFVSLPYANADAPFGGKIVLGEVGSFDSLNPHILKGTAPWQLRFLAYESLMGRSYDEPFTLYGLLAESIEVGPNREWAEFTIRPEARFSDGSPVTVEDVMWSYETLGTKGHGRYRGLWPQIESMEQTGERSVRFTFSEDNRELAMIVGMRPILKKAQWDGIDFANSGLDVVPISSAPYLISDYEPGRFVELSRDPNYWGKDIPFRKGTNVLDTIRMEFFADSTAHFEAFKGGLLNSIRETNVEKWRTQYDFPRVQNGEVVKSEIGHDRPTGLYGFVMNTRRQTFADWRVREAMLLAFNFEYINDVQTGGSQPRVTSYFSNSVLEKQDGPAEGRVRELLEPFADDLLPGALEGYSLPESDGTPRNRANLAKAMDLLTAAGWTVDAGTLVDDAGQPFEFEILIRQGQSDNAAIADIYVTALERLGIAATVIEVDSAQYEDRIANYDYDMTYYERGASLSPGNEQKLYWGADGVETPGSRNYMGMNSPAAEAMIDTMLSAESRDDFVAAARALDRVLASGRYVIPIMYRYDKTRIAHAKELKYSEDLPIYGDWLEFQPDVWWWDKTE